MSWQPIVDGLFEAWGLISTLNPEVTEITFRSLVTAGVGTILAAFIGLPLGVLIAIRSFRGKHWVKTFMNTLVGVPTVTLGLFIYALFSRNGPLGVLELLYTVPGIAIGEAVLVIPILVSFTTSAIESKDIRLRDLVKTLGASEYDTSLAIIREASAGISLALVSSFNRAFAELGIAMMLGANIRGVTRVLTTSIALQTNMGEMGLAFALSFILLTVVLTLNIIMSYLRRYEE